MGLFLTQSCSNGSDYKAVREQIVVMHDKIMGEDGQLMSDKAKLKNLSSVAGLQQIKTAMPQADTAAEKLKITTLAKQLDSVSNSMSDWMAAFNPDAEGKTDDQATAYFKGEKVKVTRIDSSYNVLLKTAGDYLKKFNIKPDTAAKSQPMKMKM